MVLNEFICGIIVFFIIAGIFGTIKGYLIGFKLSSGDFILDFPYEDRNAFAYSAVFMLLGFGQSIRQTIKQAGLFTIISTVSAFFDNRFFLFIVGNKYEEILVGIKLCSILFGIIVSFIFFLTRGKGWTNKVYIGESKQFKNTINYIRLPAFLAPIFFAFQGALIGVILGRISSVFNSKFFSNTLEFILDILN